MDTNVVADATKPSGDCHEPDPPTPQQAARLLNLVSEDDAEFGLYLWTSFVSGGRRGEMLGLRENRIDFGNQELRFARNHIARNGKRIDKAPKNGKGRRVSIDPLTGEMLRDHIQRRRMAAAEVGVQVPEDAYVFSPDPVGAAPWHADTMTHRYERYARRVGITSALEETRHYSATQLLQAGVDLTTVAGRLGHSEGATTLRFYAQFVPLADKRAATVIPDQLDALRRQHRAAQALEG